MRKTKVGSIEFLELCNNYCIGKINSIYERFKFHVRRSRRTIIIIIMNLLCANSMHICSNAHYSERYTLKVKIKAN